MLQPTRNGKYSVSIPPYTTSVFLKGLFYKYGVCNKAIQVQLTYLYGDLIDYVLQNATDAQRVYIFRSFLKVFETSIDILIKDDAVLSDASERLVKSFVSFCRQLIVDTVFKLQSGSEVFRHILGQVNLEEIVCDMGVLIGQYKDTNSLRLKIKNTIKLKLLLDEYNLITDNSLSVRDVLSGK